jgi:hypothetical protein
MSTRPVSGGQTLVEFLIVMLFVLLPLMLIVPVLAQMIALRQDTEVAARYAAWERTVWFRPGSPEAAFESEAARDDATIARFIEQHVLADGRRGISSVVSADPVALDPFLLVSHRRSLDQDYLLDEVTDGSGTYVTQDSTETDPPGFATGFMDGVIGVVSGFSPRFNMNDQGYHRAEVSLALIDLSWLGGAFASVDPLRYSRSNTLFAEPWNAGGAAHAEYAVSGLVPMTLMDNSMVRNFQNVMSFGAEEFSSSSLRFGHTDIEPVPPHRLSNF